MSLESDNAQQVDIASRPAVPKGGEEHPALEDEAVAEL